MSHDKTLHVYADWESLGSPRLMGLLQISQVEGREVFSFEYTREWLAADHHYPLLDPQLQLVEGRQFGDGPFGLFLDSAPDRWGRMLIDRREAHLARSEERSPRRFLDSDYLLAVDDRTRMGALRFKEDPDGAFLADVSDRPIAPLEQLRTLEQSSLALEATTGEDPHTLDWLRLLLAPGSSLGGARPKANVIDPKEELWIAKFPSRQDSLDTGAWESLVYQLAGEAGLRIVPTQRKTFSEVGTTFLVKRFDRSGSTRTHFASAMTLLGYRDGDGADSGASYLDLVDWIETSGAYVEQDLEELWKRIVFSILVGNTDDHLRNHGFLLHQKGWALSPVYDLNPNPWAYGLSLNINETSNALELDLAREVAGFFRIPSVRQKKIIQDISRVVQQWEKLAKERGLSRMETDQMRPAFARADLH